MKPMPNLPILVLSFSFVDRNSTSSWFSITSRVMPQPRSLTDARMRCVASSYSSLTSIAGEPASIAFCTSSRKNAFGSANCAMTSPTRPSSRGASAGRSKAESRYGSLTADPRVGVGDAIDEFLDRVELGALAAVIVVDLVRAMSELHEDHRTRRVAADRDIRGERARRRGADGDAFLLDGQLAVLVALEEACLVDHAFELLELVPRDAPRSPAERFDIRVPDPIDAPIAVQRHGVRRTGTEALRALQLHAHAQRLARGRLLGGDERRLAILCTSRPTRARHQRDPH